MIIFIDDQIESADLYLDELSERGLEYKFFQNVDEAWGYLSTAERKPAVVVVDIMMPNGALFSAAETSDGLTTGVRFYRLLRERFPECFIVALTNLSSPIIHETLGGDSRAAIHRKDEIFYDELADQIEDLIRAER